MKNKYDLNPGKVRNLSTEKLVGAFLEHAQEPMPLITDAHVLLNELKARGIDTSAPGFDEDDCPLCIGARVDIVANRLMAH